MRDRPTIEKEIPGKVGFNDNWNLDGIRNTQKLAELNLEVLLDIRDAMKKPKPKRRKTPTKVMKAKMYKDIP